MRSRAIWSSPVFVAEPSPLERALRLERGCPLEIRRTPRFSAAQVSLAELRALEEEAIEAIAEEQLSARERETFRALQIPKRRFEWLGGRLAAKWAVIAERTREGSAPGNPAEIEIQTEPDGPSQGRPWVPDGPEISITHSWDFAIALASPRPIGVDIERMRPVAPTIEEFAIAEGEDITSVPLLVRWAAKEALLKLVGTGLRSSMREVIIHRWNRDGSLVWSVCGEIAEALKDVEAWAGLSEGYACAVAIANR